MITVRLTDTLDGVEVLASGHADYAPAGQDIVCAGVSALVYGTMVYLSDTAQAQRDAGCAARAESDVGSDYVWIITHGFADGSDRRAVRQLEAGVRVMERMYPECVRVQAFGCAGTQRTAFACAECRE